MVMFNSYVNLPEGILNTFISRCLKISRKGHDFCALMVVSVHLNATVARLGSEQKLSRTFKACAGRCVMEEFRTGDS